VKADRTYVLDANALLDFIEDGPGAAPVERLLGEAHRHNRPLMASVVNLGEVFYHAWQERGEEVALGTMASLSRLPVEPIPVDLQQSLKAGEIKAKHKIPYVDCIAAALAEMREAVLVTSDRDFEKLGRRVRVLWLTRP